MKLKKEDVVAVDGFCSITLLIKKDSDSYRFISQYKMFETIEEKDLLEEFGYHGPMMVVEMQVSVTDNKNIWLTLQTAEDRKRNK